MYKLARVAGLLLAGLFLWGCGKSGADSNKEAEAISATSIEVQKDGTIIETITEDFKESSYDDEGLKNMMLSEVAEFNNNGQDDISVDKFEVKNDVIVVVIRYPSAKAYTEYNANPYDNKTLFFGTVSQAYDAGYSLDIALSSAKNGEESIGKEEILAMGDRHILISGEPVQVQTYGRILYTGENVSLTGKNKAAMYKGEEGRDSGEYYLIF